jgi:hypothetical protein
VRARNSHTACSALCCSTSHLHPRGIARRITANSLVVPYGVARDPCIMSQALAGPEWTKSGSCRSRYKWHPDNNKLQIGKFNQATRITLAKRQARSKNAKIEPKLYACKWYATAGLGQMNSGGASISGLKYVQREAAAFASINHPSSERFQEFS